MTITYHRDIDQLSDAWHAMKCGVLSAGSFKLILTPGKLLPSDNDKTRAHVYELAAQRLTKYVEPQFVNDEMLRGLEIETDVRELYAEHYAPVESVGFVTNDNFGFLIGCSPDGLVGEDGGIEIKSRRQKFQIETITEDYANGTCPTDYMLQVQGSLLITQRKWWDFISWHGGLPATMIRVYPDPMVHMAIVEAAAKFEAKIAEKIAKYEELMAAPDRRLFPTERKDYEQSEIFV